MPSGSSVQRSTLPPSPPSPPSMLEREPGPRIYNVIDAEDWFEISEITDYHSYFASPRGFVFRARFRNDSEPIRFVFCPLKIDAKRLSQDARKRLQMFLDSVKLSVPENHWKALDAKPEYSLVVFGEEDMPSKMGRDS